MRVAMAPTIVVLIIILSALVVPIFEQAEIHVEIGQDQITNAWVEVSRVPLISRLISSPKKTGIYSIDFEISQLEPIVDNWQFKVEDIPSGKYTLVWFDHAPPSGRYEIEITLIKGIILIDSYLLPVSF